jgi:transcription antitermination factor NusG
LRPNPDSDSFPAANSNVLISDAPSVDNLKSSWPNVAYDCLQTTRPLDAIAGQQTEIDHASVATQWYALRVRSRFEKIVALHLQNKGYEEYLPVYRSRRRWSDRIKEIELPLFPGYIFCKFDISRRLPVLIVPGVIAVVGIGKSPIAVSEQEIMAVQSIVKSGLTYEPSGYVTTGQTVRVQRGSLQGLVGIVLETKKNLRLIISVHLLQRSVSVEIDSDSVIPVAAEGLRS